MSAPLTLQAGSLAHHLSQARELVRANPSDADLRARLFQLSAVQGDWQRAAEQLRLSAEFNRQALPVVTLYDSAMRGETQRAAVFAGQAMPHCPVAAPAWMDDLAKALQASPAEAAELRSQALEQAEASAGQITLADGNTVDIEWICDGDSRIGPVCEFIMQGRYSWVPFAAVRSLRLLPPEGLTDLVWAQAEITLVDGRSQPCLSPARYPAQESGYAQQDEALRLGRRTEWLELSPDNYAGLGQTMWMSDQGEHALLDIRSLSLNNEDAR